MYAPPADHGIQKCSPRQVTRTWASVSAPVDHFNRRLDAAMKCVWQHDVHRNPSEIAAPGRNSATKRFMCPRFSPLKRGVGLPRLNREKALQHVDVHLVQLSAVMNIRQLSAISHEPFRDGCLCRNKVGKFGHACKLAVLGQKTTSRVASRPSGTYAQVKDLRFYKQRLQMSPPIFTTNNVLIA